MMPGSHRPYTSNNNHFTRFKEGDSLEKLVLWKSGLFIGRFLSHESKVERKRTEQDLNDGSREQRFRHTAGLLGHSLKETSKVKLTDPG